MTTSLRSVAGKGVLVTGASSGMGRAIAALFRSEGANVTAADRVAGEGIVELDVTDPAAISRVVGDAGQIDILVNNAGVSIPAPITLDDYENAWNATLDVNLLGYVRMIRACLPSLARDRVPLAIHRQQARRRWSDALACVRTRPAGHHCQLHLSRPDQYRHDRADPGRRQGEVRSSPRSLAALRRTG